VSLETPEKIRNLRTRLYAKAKAEPAFRFYLLYDKVHREGILDHAYRLARSNGGAPGVDGMKFADIEAAGREEWLASLREELRTGTYKPSPVRRVMIPKPGGGERPLGIPTIRDRVAQTAAKLVLEPIFEADLSDSAFGYREGRSATCIRNARDEHFDFLGYTFGPERYRKDGHWYLAAKPSKKSVQRVKEKVRTVLKPGNQRPWPAVATALNRQLRGWSNYFSYGTRLLAYRAVDNYVTERVRHFLRRRHKVPTRGTRCFDACAIFGELGVLRLRKVHLGAPP